MRKRDRDKTDKQREGETEIDKQSKRMNIKKRFAMPPHLRYVFFPFRCVRMYTAEINGARS